MRRLRTIVALVLAGVALTPVSADAYFWAWLDELSGPKFWGGVIEWRVYCRTEAVVEQRRELQQRRNEWDERLQSYQAAGRAARQQGAKTSYASAAQFLSAALEFIDLALRTLDTEPGANVLQQLAEASRWSAYADANARWAERLEQGTAAAGLEPPQPEETERMRMLAGFVPAPIGVSVSLCGDQPGHRDVQYLNVAVGYAWDVKDENSAFRHRMVTIGASYHLVATEALTVGTGAGVAIFTSKAAGSFQKLYLQPVIVDVRPFQFWERFRYGSPWWHVPFVRGSLVTFPTGFEAGSFGNQPDRYQAELLRSVGLHFDLAPVMKEWQGKWRRRQPR